MKSLFFENLNPLGDITDKQAFETYLWSKSIEIEPKECDKLPDFSASRKYNLKSPGIKPHRTGQSNKRILGQGTSVPQTPAFTPLPDFGRDRFVLPAVGENQSGLECDKSIVKIGLGKPPQFISDVPNQSNWFNSLASVSSANHHIIIPPLRQPPSGHQHASKPPPLPPRHGHGANSASTLASAAISELSPPLPPKPPAKRETTPVSSSLSVSGTSSSGAGMPTVERTLVQPAQQPATAPLMMAPTSSSGVAASKFDFSAFDPLCASSFVEPTTATTTNQPPAGSPVWPEEPLSQAIRGQFSGVQQCNGSVLSPPALPPRRNPPSSGTMTSGGAAPGNQSPRPARGPSESPLPQRALTDSPQLTPNLDDTNSSSQHSSLSLSSSSVAPPPPLPPRRSAQSPSVPPPRPPPRRTGTPEPPPLPPKTTRRAVPAPAPRRLMGNVTTPVGAPPASLNNNA